MNENKKLNRKKILVIDDEVDVHAVTKLALDDFLYEGKNIEILSAFSGLQAKKILIKEKDIFLVLLDVVMETDTAGLEIVKFIREELNNKIIRIVIRTGQSGIVPEKHVMQNFDIDDYRTKTELTANKLFSVVSASLRTYDYMNYSENKLRENERIIRELFDNVPVSVFRSTANGKIISANSTFAETLSYDSIDELKNITINNIFFKEPDYQKLLSVLKREGIVKNYETTLVRKDGKILWVSLSIKAVIDLKGNIEYYDGIAQDITEKKQAEELIHESEEKYKTLSNTANDAIVMIDNEGNISYWNKMAEEIFGFTAEEILNKSLHKTIAPPRFYKDFQIGFNKYKNSGEGYAIGKTLELFALKKDGTEFPIELSLARTLLKNKWSTIGIIRDISERKKNDDNMKVALEKAKESDKLKSAFLANMSHEIRTPMNGIIGFLSLLKSPEITPEELQEYIDIIEISSDRMMNTLNQLLDISLIQSNQVDLSIIDTDLNKLTESLYIYYLDEVTKNGMEIRFSNSLPSKEAILRTDQSKLKTILNNLIANAIKFTSEGIIEYGYHHNNEIAPTELVFFVKDEGIGIPKDKLLSIFDLFRQVDISHTRHFEGTGLGLTIAKAYVNLLGGKIWVESVEGQGAVFYFTIPYNTKEKDKQKKVGTIITEKAKKLKILIAEDEKYTDMQISIILKNVCREILHAENGMEAVKCCRKNKDIDLILMDIKMPLLNGYEATRQIKEFNKDVIVVAQTAYAMRGDREKAIAAGCDDYITKPLNKNLLMDVIYKYFGK